MRVRKLKKMEKFSFENSITISTLNCHFEPKPLRTCTRKIFVQGIFETSDIVRNFIIIFLIKSSSCYVTVDFPSFQICHFKYLDQIYSFWDLVSCVWLAYLHSSCRCRFRSHAILIFTVKTRWYSQFRGYFFGTVDLGHPLSTFDICNKLQFLPLIRETSCRHVEPFRPWQADNQLAE